MKMCIDIFNDAYISVRFKASKSHLPVTDEHAAADTEEYRTKKVQLKPRNKEFLFPLFLSTSYQLYIRE